MNLRTKKWISVITAAMMIVSAASAVSAAPKGKGSGTVEPFSLGMTALKGKEQTDLYFQVQKKEASYNLPDHFKKIQLKSYTKEGELVYTKNFNDETAAPGGKATLVLNDVERYQPLKTMVHVKNDQTQNDVIVEGQTTVLLRPDLVVSDVQSPEEVMPDAPFTVQTNIQEVNTDLGASAKVEILNGDEVLDEVDAVNVNAGSYQGVVLAPKIQEPGDYTLTVRISGVEPGEYDTTNNEQSFQVKVVEPNHPITYSSNYWSNEGEQHSVSNDWWYGGNYSYNWQGKEEGFYLWGNTTAPVDPSGIFKVKFHNENGEAISAEFNLNTYGWYYGGNVYYGYDAVTNTGVNLYPNGSGYNINLSHYAGDYVYSNNYYGWYGYSNHIVHGKFIDAKSKIGAFIDLPSTDGSHHGGKLEYNLTSRNDVWDNTWSGWWGEYSRSWGNILRIQGSGYGTTVWE